MNTPQTAMLHFEVVLNTGVNFQHSLDYLTKNYSLNSISLPPNKVNGLVLEMLTCSGANLLQFTSKFD